MSENTNKYQRFDVAQRIEHVVLIVSFTVLALTGLPQKYSLAPISQAIIQSLGGIETIRIIHRIAAVLFVLESIYHLIVVGYKLYVLRREASMMPSIKDGKDMVQWFLYNLGLRKAHPKMPRYNFTEKMEYWAMLWGLFLMALTGFMLWNPLATARLLPGQFIPAAKAAHGAEAVLAVLAIILWHFYNVHLKKWNWSMIKGTLSKEEMEQEHGEELERLDRGVFAAMPEPAVRKKRLAVFAPAAGIFSVVSVALLVYFVTFEESSITTLPPEQRAQVIVRRTSTPLPTQPPTATPVPTEVGATAPATWEGGIADLFDKCAGCHGASGGLSVASYADLMTGGASGPGVVPGDPDGSPLVVVMQGAHPVKFSDAELAQVVDWIAAGAVEK